MPETQWLPGTRDRASREEVTVTNLVDIEEIAETYATKLREVGVETVEALLSDGASPAGFGASPRSVRSHAGSTRPRRCRAR